MQDALGVIGRPAGEKAEHAFLHPLKVISHEPGIDMSDQKAAATQIAGSLSPPPQSQAQTKQNTQAATSGRQDRPLKDAESWKEVTPKTPSKKHHYRVVDTLQSAYDAIDAYCKSLGLKLKVTKDSTFLLGQVFSHGAFAEFSEHSLIPGCIVCAAHRARIRIDYDDIFSPRIARHERGETMMTLIGFLLDSIS